MRPLSIVIALFAWATMPSALHSQGFDDPFKDYLKRSDTILLGAGNAKDTNAAIHTITPWPPYAYRTQIPGDGRRAVGSVERMYSTPDPFERQGTAAHVGTAGPGGEPGGGSGLGNASPTPVQPVQSGY